MSDTPVSDADKIVGSIDLLASKVEELNETLWCIKEIFEEITGHIYGDKNQPRFIRTSEIGD